MYLARIGFVLSVFASSVCIASDNENYIEEFFVDACLMQKAEKSSYMNELKLKGAVPTTLPGQGDLLVPTTTLKVPGPLTLVLSVNKASCGILVMLKKEDGVDSESIVNGLRGRFSYHKKQDQESYKSMESYVLLSTDSKFKKKPLLVRRIPNMVPLGEMFNLSLLNADELMKAQ